jgi:hypothetical protein
MVGTLQADLQFEQVTLLNGPMIDGLNQQAMAEGRRRMDEITSVVYVKKDRVRVDSYSGKELLESLIYSLPQREMITLNHLQKIYARETFEHFRKQLPYGGASVPASTSGTGQETKKTLKIPGSIKDLREQRIINGFNSRHYQVARSFAVPGGNTSRLGEFELVSDLWISEEKLGFEELEQFHSALITALGDTEEARAELPPKELVRGQQLLQGLEEIRHFAMEQKGIPIKQVSEFNLKYFLGAGGPENQSDRNAGSPRTMNSAEGGSSLAPPSQEGRNPSQPKRLLTKITREVRRISRLPLEDSIFEIPKEYRRAPGPSH